MEPLGAMHLNFCMEWVVWIGLGQIKFPRKCHFKISSHFFSVESKCTELMSLMRVIHNSPACSSWLQFLYGLVECHARKDLTIWSLPKVFEGKSKRSTDWSDSGLRQIEDVASVFIWKMKHVFIWRSNLFQLGTFAASYRTSSQSPNPPFAVLKRLAESGEAKRLISLIKVLWPSLYSNFCCAQRSYFLIFFSSKDKQNP